MRNPYDILGVAKQADAETVRAAYRKLAKKYHPDLNPNDGEAEKRFKEASQAFDILGDEEKRAQFDRGEIDADGNPKAPFGFGGFGGAEGDFRTARGPGGERVFFQGGFDDIGDMFGDIFQGAFGGAGPDPRRGARRAQAGPEQARAEAAVDFLTAVKGGKARVNGPGGEAFEVTIPAGLKDGKTLRLRGKGPVRRGGVRGDLLLTMRVKPHPDFRREGDDIRSDLPVSLKEAVLGAKVTAETIDGPVQIAVPKGSKGSTVLRLRGKGAPKGDGTQARGDHYLALRITLPDGPQDELERFLKTWSKADAPVRD